MTISEGTSTAGDIMQRTAVFDTLMTPDFLAPDGALFSNDTKPSGLQRERACRESIAAEAVLSWQFATAQTALIVLASITASISYNLLALGMLVLVPASTAMGLLAAALFVGGMRIVDSTRRLRKPAGPEALRDVSLVWTSTILLITFLIFSLKAGEGLSRGAMLGFFLIGYPAVVSSRILLPRLLADWTRAGRTYDGDILVIGAENRAMSARIMAELSHSGYANVTAMELPVDCSESEWQEELPLSLARIFARARDGGHGDICIAAEGFSTSRLRDIAEAIRVLPRAVRLVPESTTENLLHLPLRSIGRVRSVEIQRAPVDKLQRGAKRALDIAIAMPALLCIAPFLLAIAVLIKIDSKGPALFVQSRRGYRGHPFGIFKFRTMKVLEDGAEIRQATRDDARVTRIGRWLRKYSIDELPQLLNVILGQMSLVGPRPHAVAHDEHYGKRVMHYEVRQHVKPGITGWAQVNGLRGETTSDELMRRRIDLDIWYAKNAGLWLDIKIILLTVVEICRTRNAY